MSTDNVPTGLRIEHGPEALGVGTATPRLSWRLPADSAAQSAFTIEIDTGGGGVERLSRKSAEHVLIAWPAAPLASGQAVRWRVQVATDAGTSAWSDWHGFELGVLDNAE